MFRVKVTAALLLTLAASRENFRRLEEAGDEADAAPEVIDFEDDLVEGEGANNG